MRYINNIKFKRSFIITPLDFCYLMTYNTGYNLNRKGDEITMNTTMNTTFYLFKNNNIIKSSNDINTLIPIIINENLRSEYYNEDIDSLVNIIMRILIH